MWLDSSLGNLFYNRHGSQFHQISLNYYIDGKSTESILCTASGINVPLISGINVPLISGINVPLISVFP